MDEIRFVPLSDIPESAIIALMNEPQVGKYLPLLAGGFSAEDCRAFLAAKARLWEEHGYGPWGILIQGEFAGWGGLQPEAGEADFALVLHPMFWGWGRRIFGEVRERAFGEMGLDSMTILLPPSRPNWKAVMRLGFVADGEVVVGGEVFLRFRMVRG